MQLFESALHHQTNRSLRGRAIAILLSLFLIAPLATKVARAQPNSPVVDGNQSSSENIADESTTQSSDVSSDGSSLQGNPIGKTAGTSDSGELRNRLRFRIEQVLSKTKGAGELQPYGNPGGYHWIFLLQVARYPDSNVRFTDMRRGIQAFLEDLVASRRSWPTSQVQDTVSLLPYHFNLLGNPRERIQNLRSSLKSPSSLKQRVPGEPQNDTYQGAVWQDGHDWRAALGQSLEWMKKTDLTPQNSIIIVLDWNDLAQAPQTLASGQKATATDKNLVMPSNRQSYAKFEAAMKTAGLDEKKGLETVQVGNLEYDMAVFAPTNLSSLSIQSQGQTDCPPGQNKNESGACVSPSTSSQSSTPIGFFIFFLLVAGGVVLFMLPCRFKINDDKVEVLRRPNRTSLEIVGEGVESKAPAHFQLSRREVPQPPDRALATVRLNFPKKITVTDGAYQVKASRGFKEVPGGLEMTGRSGEFELRSGDRLITLVELRLL